MLSGPAFGSKNDSAMSSLATLGPGGETTSDHANKVGAFNVRTRAIGITNNGACKINDQIGVVTRGAGPIRQYAEPTTADYRRPFTPSVYTMRERPLSRCYKEQL